MQRTILITGGAGYIGSHIGYLLAQMGYHIIILDTHPHSPSAHAFKWATNYCHDYGDTKILDELFKSHAVNAVIHCAALSDINQSVIDPHLFYENNVEKTIRLLDRMRMHHIPYLIVASSSTVYGNPTIIPIDETYPLMPISPYGKTKQMIEMILQDYSAAYGIRYICLRLFNTAGGFNNHIALHQSPASENQIIPSLIRSACTGKPFTIFGTNYKTSDGTCIRDYTHVLDIADAHIRALHHLMQKDLSDTFNIGTGNGTSVRELISIVEQLYNLKLILKTGEARPGDPAILIAHASRAKDILGWNPRYSTLEFIIRSAHASLMRAKK